MLRTILIAVVAVVVVGALAALALAGGLFGLSLPELEKRYTTPDSKFMDVDGMRVHYMDQGSGPPVILVHASFMSLRMWDSLAANLAKDHRVVRFDMLTNGLTGPDPSGQYSMDRNVQILGTLADRLGLQKFALLGTSSGGIVAFRYAAANPGRVERLVLANSAGLPRTAATDPNRPRGTALERWILARHKSRAYWEDNLRNQFTGGSPPPPELVQMTYDFNRRDTLRAEGAAMMKAFRTGDPKATLAQITAPTLVMWAMGNITVDHLQGDVFEHWLTGAPSLLKKYEKVGHYFYVEPAGREPFERDVRAFLDGRLDGDLRRTMRLPVGTAATLAPAAAPAAGAAAQAPAQAAGS